MSQPLYQILAGQPDRVNWSAFSSADWDLLVTTARAHGVAPLLYHLLTETGWSPQTPPHLRRDLRTAYYATAAQNHLLYQELSHVLTAIRDSQLTIPAVVLKGAALAPTIYPDPALRPLGDLDLLVPREHLEPAVQAVLSLGYRSPGLEIPEMGSGLNQMVSNQIRLRGGPSRAVILELHWGLIAGDTDWRAPSLDWFWQQTERWKVEKGKWKRESGKGKMEDGKWEVEGGGDDPTSILQLTPTAHLLYLAAHLMLQHGGAEARLLWFYDLHLLLTRCESRVDWDELLERARQFRWAAALHAALQGARNRFDTPLPHGFLDALDQVRDPQAVRAVERKRKDGSIQTRAGSVWDNLTFQSWPARFRLAWALAFPSLAYMRWRYNPRPAWLWPLWYSYRWFDILRDGLSTLWRIGKGKGEQGNKETRG